MAGFEAIMPVQITMEFNVVLEYIPKPILYQMVERKVAIVSPIQTAKAENEVARVNPGIPQKVIDATKQIIQMSDSGLRETVKQLAPSARQSAIAHIRNIARGVITNAIPAGLTVAGLAATLGNIAMKIPVFVSYKEFHSDELKKELAQSSDDEEQEDYTNIEGGMDLTPNSNGSIIMLDTHKKNVVSFSKKRDGTVVQKNRD